MMLIPIVAVEYAWLAMSLGSNDEGSTNVIHEPLSALLKGPRSRNALLILTLIGISLLTGNGVITPASSILSAVDGLELIPGLDGIGTDLVVLLAAGIANALNAFRRCGTIWCGFPFDPMMAVWFTALTLMGRAMILKAPVVLFTINPRSDSAFFSRTASHLS